MHIPDRQLTIHAGLNKTASSSIQLALRAHADCLRDNGYYFPELVDWDGEIVKNHSRVFQCLFGSNPEKYPVIVNRGWSVAEVKPFYEKQLHELSYRAENHHVIFSGEDISRLHFGGLLKLREFFSSYHVRVIVYVRDPYEMTCSSLQERIKMGRAVLSDLAVVRASDRIQCLQSVFPDTECYSFEKSTAAQAGLVGHFLGLLGIEAADLDTEQYQNKGLSNRLTRLLSFLNEQEPRWRNGQKNPVWGGLVPKKLEFSDASFKLTPAEFESISEPIETERRRLSEFSGLNFTQRPSLSKELGDLSRGEVEVLLTKTVMRNSRLKGLILDYLAHQVGVVPKHLFEENENADPDVLRDAAIFLERTGDISGAYRLMSRALAARPHGPLIQEKMKEYAFKLGRDTWGMGDS
jgi:hypothetical protein